MVFVIPRGSFIQKGHIGTGCRKLLSQEFLEQMVVAVDIPVEAAQKGVGPA